MGRAERIEAAAMAVVASLDALSAAGPAEKLTAARASVEAHNALRAALAAPAERQEPVAPMKCANSTCSATSGLEWMLMPFTALRGERSGMVDCYCPVHAKDVRGFGGWRVVCSHLPHPPAAGKEAQAQPAPGAEAVRALVREAYSVGYSAGCAGSPASTRASDLKMLDGRVDALPPAPPERGSAASDGGEGPR